MGREIPRLRERTGRRGVQGRSVPYPGAERVTASLLSEFSPARGTGPRICGLREVSQVYSGALTGPRLFCEALRRTNFYSGRVGELAVTSTHLITGLSP